MVSAISFGWFADFGKTLTIIQRSSQPVYSDKWQAPPETRRCYTRLAKCAGRNFRSTSFSSDRWRANISARWRRCGNNVGGSLTSSGERFLELHILTKYFVGRLTAVDVFYSIQKAAVFNAEQLILGITASRYVEYLWSKGKLFPFLTSSNSILFRTVFLRCLDLGIMYQIDNCGSLLWFAATTPKLIASVLFRHVNALRCARFFPFSLPFDDCPAGY